MKGDFSRDTFDSTDHFRRVLMQQGRVQLDADANEQASIVLHYIETLAADLLGPYAATANGFQIESTGKKNDGDFIVKDGHLYIDGLLCENDAGGDLHYTTQSYAPPQLDDKRYLAYVDAWERHIGAVEDPSIADVALGGLDTSTRGAVVWQVRTEEFKAEELTADYWNGRLEAWQPANRGRLETKARDQKPSNDPCNLQPDSQYRGAENQLYRIEIHHNGTADEGATYMWSRDNGFRIFAITSVEDDGCTLAYLGRDDHSTLLPGDWVEVVDDTISLGEPDADALPLRQITEVNTRTLRVRFKKLAAPTTAGQGDHPYLRRWDHGRGKGEQTIAEEHDGALAIAEGKWIDLEDGVQVSFHPAGGTDQQHYRRGDYWQIPARVATGDVDWPPGTTTPPRGVHHHYAPLATLTVANSAVTVDKDERRLIIETSKPA